MPAIIANEQIIIVNCLSRLFFGLIILYPLINFKNFCKFPIYDYNDDGKWPETKKNNVPWGELITETVIFTLPVTKIKQLISDKIIDTVINKIDFIAHTMSSFMDSYEMLASYRFVFDVEMFKDMYTGYPITLPLDQIDNILYDFKKCLK